MRHNHQIVCHQLLYVLFFFIDCCKDEGNNLINKFFLWLKNYPKIFNYATVACFFQSKQKTNFNLKIFLFLLFTGPVLFAKGQNIDSIYVHLYTDSLKKGTFNYINIDGKLSDGSYIPLDTSNIFFSSSDGKFYGNSLYIDPGFSNQKVKIKAVLKSNPLLHKEFTIYIKKIPDPAKLKTLDEILNGSKRKKRI